MQKARRHTTTGAPTACRHTVSGSLSLPCAGCFSPFPHGTRPLSVSREYLALPDGPGRFTQNSSCSALLRILLEQVQLARTGLSPSAGELSRSFRFVALLRIAVLLPRRCRNSDGLGFSPFARHYWGNHSCFLFLEVLRCFSSLGSPHQKVMPRLQHGGLSHSEIPESTAICASTGLIAAYHVLLRLQEPRHPPCALHILPVASPQPCTHIYTCTCTCSTARGVNIHQAF